MTQTLNRPDPRPALPRNLRTGFLWLFMATIALWLQGCNNAAAPDAQGADAPAFTLTAANGESVSLDDYVGQQSVLLYFHMAVG